ncbi:MAG: DUF6776 family protein [Gammaproteobacteria bacterium]|nr:DUF6776 family protein [Gammaproteobacteria bacterium]
MAEQTLKLQDVVRDQSLALDYRFRHFKRFEGSIELPPAFKPRRVRVRLLPEGNSHAEVEKVFDWSDVAGQRARRQTIPRRIDTCWVKRKKRRAKRIDTLVGQHSRVLGDVHFKGGLHVDWQHQAGNARCRTG